VKTIKQDTKAIEVISWDSVESYFLSTTSSHGDSVSSLWCETIALEYLGRWNAKTIASTNKDEHEAMLSELIFMVREGILSIFALWTVVSSSNPPQYFIDFLHSEVQRQDLLRWQSKVLALKSQSTELPVNWFKVWLPPSMHATLTRIPRLYPESMNMNMNMVDTDGNSIPKHSIVYPLQARRGETTDDIFNASQIALMITGDFYPLNIHHSNLLMGYWALFYMFHLPSLELGLQTSLREFVTHSRHRVDDASNIVPTLLEAVMEHMDAVNEQSLISSLASAVSSNDTYDVDAAIAERCKIVFTTLKRKIIDEIGETALKLFIQTFSSLT
jgi:hypothetical protein